MDYPNPEAKKRWLERYFTRHVPEIVAPEDNPETIAKHAILVLEKAIHDTFGVEMHAGVEMEYGYHLSEDLAKKLIPSIRIDSDIHATEDYLGGEKRYDYVPARYRLESPEGGHTLSINTAEFGEKPTEEPIATVPIGDSLYPESRWISHSYCERSPNAKNWAKHEHVISHHAEHDRIPFGEGRMLVLAAQTEQLRKEIAATPPEKTKFAKDKLHNAWIKTVLNSITERSTRATSPHGNTNGMHLNLSFTFQGKNILESSVTKQMLQTDMEDVLREGQHVLLVSDAATSRSHRRAKYPLVATPYSQNGARIEITQPSTESNPYYATLLSLISVYHALEMNAFSKEHGTFKRDFSLPEGLYKAPHNNNTPDQYRQEAQERFFNGHHLIREILDELEPSLGEKFESAIARVPPGTEKPSTEAGIVGPTSYRHR